jgi:hypothetical protein
MRHSLIRAAVLNLLLVPLAVASAGAGAADAPRPDPLREHELAIRKVLESWNDIATALSLIRDARTAVRHQNTLRDSLIAASQTGKRMAELPRPSAEDDRALCQRVLPLARSVRARFKRESDRVLAIPDLGPETRELAPKLALVEGALDKLIAKAESGPPPKPGPAAAAAGTSGAGAGKSDPKPKATP